MKNHRARELIACRTCVCVHVAFYLTLMHVYAHAGGLSLLLSSTEEEPDVVRALAGHAHARATRTAGRACPSPWSRGTSPLAREDFDNRRARLFCRGAASCLPTVLRRAKRRLIYSVCFSRELSQRRFYADIMIEIPAKLNKLFMLSLGRASRISLIVFANATFCQMQIFSCYFVAVCLNTGHVRILYFFKFRTSSVKCSQCLCRK